MGPAQLGLVDEAVRGFVAEHANLLHVRAEEGWIREGQSELRAEHVGLEPDGAIQIFECVEFNRSLRCADVASDLAFLLMDLERLGARETVDTLIARYEAAGLDLPEALLRFYKAHRALVRAKIACLERASFADEAA